MPIYEFKCTKCEEFFELLVIKSNDDEIIKCPKCESSEFERVMSTTNYAMGSSSGSSGSNNSSNVQERACSSGSCSTYTIPGQD